MFGTCKVSELHSLPLFTYSFHSLWRVFMYLVLLVLLLLLLRLALALVWFSFLRFFVVVVLHNICILYFLMHTAVACDSFTLSYRQILRRSSDVSIIYIYTIQMERSYFSKWCSCVCFEYIFFGRASIHFCTFLHGIRILPLPFAAEEQILQHLSIHIFVFLCT